MTEPTTALKQYRINIGLEKDVDFLRQVLKLLSQMLTEIEVDQQVGAGKHERKPDRKNYRNGYHKWTWKNRVGEINLAIPKLRKGSYFPSLLEPCSPWQNDYIESFNGKMRDELLEREIFYSLKEAQILIEMWRTHYNTVRPHSSLGYIPLAPAAIEVQYSQITQVGLTS